KMDRPNQITVNGRDPLQGVGMLNAERRPGTTPAYRAAAARNAPTMAARSITPATTPYRVPRSIETSMIARVVQSIQFTVMVRAIPSERNRLVTRGAARRPAPGGLFEPAGRFPPLPPR